MDEQQGATRIVVMARPSLGRSIAATLQIAGYEVHRTPGDADLVGLVARLQAGLVIVALDLPWLDAVDVLLPLIVSPHPVPVLLLGEADGDHRVDELARLPLSVDSSLLLKAVMELLAIGDPQSDGRKGLS